MLTGIAGTAARMAAAKSPADYAKLATPILDVVDELEKPFEK